MSFYSLISEFQPSSPCNGHLQITTDMHVIFTILENINDCDILNLLALGCSCYETISIIQHSVTIGEICIKLHSDKFFHLNICSPKSWKMFYLQ